jgi:propionyl-CoA carboxylase alpha chain
MFRKILIANRGEIACRIMRTARRMGIATVAVHSEADARALHVAEADEAVPIGPAEAGRSYLRIEAILEACRSTGAEAVHPGYGFLSERADFAAALERAGIAFIGPSSAAIAALGDKIAAKALARAAGVPVVPGSDQALPDLRAARTAAAAIGYPVMLKASAGGGGKGMRIARSPAELDAAFAPAANEARAAFGDDRLFLEKFIDTPRHLEIQILADGKGRALHLGERECSIQRRNQKVIEEAPSPFASPDLRRRMGEAAVALALKAGYASAGTVEYIVDSEGNFYFLEMNTRLQVEHAVTELVTGIDIVEQMIRIAAGESLTLRQSAIRLKGAALECRLYAEDPLRGFLPSTGRLSRYRPPAELPGRLRLDSGIAEGGEISRHYDPMIAKLCTWAEDRNGAIEAMRGALDEFELAGVGHNLGFCAAVLDTPAFIAGATDTGFIAREFPDGFRGAVLPEATLRRLAAGAACLYQRLEARAVAISGTMANHNRHVGPDWVVAVGGRYFDTHLTERSGVTAVTLGDEVFEVETAWNPGETLARARINGRTYVAQVRLTTGGASLTYRGATLMVRVMSPRLAELARKMPPKAPRENGKTLLCPMPGLVAALHVAEGDLVEEGQPLLVIEAMKMENLLRSDRRGRIGKLMAKAGETLAADAVILEYA